MAWLLCHLLCSLGERSVLGASPPLNLFLNFFLKFLFDVLQDTQIHLFLAERSVRRRCSARLTDFEARNQNPEERDTRQVHPSVSSRVPSVCKAA